MKRILAATNLKPVAAKALARAFRLAARDGAAIRVLHAIPERADSAAQEHRLGVETGIMAEELASTSADLSTRVSASRPADAILEEAETFGADLVVIGAHGEPRLRDAIFGTTGTHVVRHAACPVLVVQDGPGEPYSRVMLAVENPAAAARLLAAAEAVAPAAEVFAVRAFRAPFPAVIDGGEAYAREELRREEELEDRLAEAGAGRTAAGLTASRHAIVEIGEATGVLSEEVERLAPDLLVMGTRRGAPFLGSHAVDALFWSPVDVLVLPDRADAPDAPDALGVGAGE